MDQLDRILADDEPLVPSSRFAERVMEAVHEAAAAPPPLPFPWRRFALGIASSVAGMASGAALVAQPGAGIPPEVLAALASVSNELGVAALSVLATLAVMRGRRMAEEW
jgi:hypothetical protein